MNKKILGMCALMALSNFANSEIVETSPREIKEDLQSEKLNFSKAIKHIENPLNREVIYLTKRNDSNNKI